MKQIRIKKPYKLERPGRKVKVLKKGLVITMSDELADKAIKSECAVLASMHDVVQKKNKIQKEVKDRE